MPLLDSKLQLLNRAQSAAAQSRLSWQARLVNLSAELGHEQFNLDQVVGSAADAVFNAKAALAVLAANIAVRLDQVRNASLCTHGPDCREIVLLGFQANVSLPLLYRQKAVADAERLKALLALQRAKFNSSAAAAVARATAVLSAAQQQSEKAAAAGKIAVANATGAYYAVVNARIAELRAADPDRLVKLARTLKHFECPGLDRARQQFERINSSAPFFASVTANKTRDGVCRDDRFASIVCS